MIQIALEPTDEAVQRGISGLSLGHLTVRNGDTTVTSRDRRPDQSMQVFIALIDLLDGLRQLVSDPQAREFTFVASDSSFQAHFTRTPAGIRGDVHGHDLGVVPERELIDAAWQGATEFLNRYEPGMSGGDIVRSDLADSLMDYASTFNLRR